jgi:RNA recognition motif-containing protein
MGKKLYVGNLPFSATDDGLMDLFQQVGTVESAKVITDRDTGRSKGFGFVEMSTDQEAAQAISKFNGTDFDGRALTVNEARPMAPREGGGGGRGFGGGGGRDKRGGGGGGRQRW